jgi:hypothetical protein
VEVVGDAVIEQAIAVPRRVALYLPSPPTARLALFFRWEAITSLAARHRKLAFPLTLAASAVAGALTTSAVLDWQDSKSVTAAIEPVPNETVVYLQKRPPMANPEQGDSQHPDTVQVEASDEIDDGDIPSNFPRAVQTVRSSARWAGRDQRSCPGDRRPGPASAGEDRLALLPSRPDGAGDTKATPRASELDP